MELVLVDFDDTLVDTAPRFLGARDRLFSLLLAQGFAPREIHRVHHEEVDPEFLRRHGFGPFRLGASFRETYRRLSRERGRRPDPWILDQCTELGNAVLGPPPLLAGALEALVQVVRALPTAIYTQASDPDYQLHCIRSAGVLDILPESRVHITPRKTVEAFRETMARFSAQDAATVCMVGNSMRSDVNPALANGAHAIFVEQEEAWIHDHDTPLKPDIPRVRSFREAAGLLLSDAARLVQE